MLTQKIETPPFYAARVRMAVHYTMGGIVINEKAQVLSKEREPIKGLYAAGEVTTGVHGSNRVGGNGLWMLLFSVGLQEKMPRLVFDDLAHPIFIGYEKKPALLTMMTEPELQAVIQTKENI